VLGFLLLACLCGAAAAQGRPIYIARRVAPLSSIRGATGGSLQAVVTASGVETTKRAFQPQLLNQILGSLHLPTISGQTPITLLGITVNLHYQVGNISISNVTFANDTIDIVPARGINFALTNGKALIDADFSYSIPSIYLSGAGKADITVDQLALKAELDVGADAKGYPLVSCPVASVVLGVFNTKISSDSTIIDVIINFFLYLLNGSVRNQIQTAITMATYNTLNKTVNELIHNQTLFVGLPPNGSHAVVDISLPSAPVFDPNYILLPLKGEVLLEPDQHSGYTPAPLPTLASRQMLQVIVGRYLLDTAGWTYFKSGVLEQLVTNDDVPSWFPFKLNTESLSAILPALNELCKGCDMNLDFLVSQPITSKINSAGDHQGVEIKVVGDMVANIIAPNGTWISVFDLELVTIVKFKLYFNGSNSVHGLFHVVSFTSNVKSSRIGYFDPSTLSFVLSLLIDNVLIYPVNAYLDANPLFTFPEIFGFHYVNPTLLYHPDYIALSADFANSGQ